MQILPKTRKALMEKQPDGKDDLMLVFTAWGCKSAIPKIFRFLVQDIHYVDWEPGHGRKARCINLEDVQETVSKFGDGHEGQDRRGLGTGDLRLLQPRPRRGRQRPLPQGQMGRALWT